MRNFVKRQSTRSIKKQGHSRISAYWDYVEKHGRIVEGLHEELTRSNPDRLEHPEDCGLSLAKSVFGSAVEHLQGRQKEVYILHMREDKSLAEVAAILDMTKSTAQVYLTRAIKFIGAYCRQAITKEQI